MQTKALLNKLIGSNKEQPIESRLLNGISLFSSLAMLILCISIFIYGNSSLALGLLTSSLVFASSYYLGFSRGKTLYSQWVFVLSVSFTAYLSFSYFKGISSPGFYGLIIGFFVAQLCAPNQRWKLIYYLFFTLLGIYFIFLKSEEVTALHFIYFIGYLLFTAVLYFGLSLLMAAYRSMADKAFVEGEELKHSNRLIQEQLQEMRALNEQKDRLFSIIGHDLRNPLNAIEGFMSVLEQDEISPNIQKELQKELLKLTRGSRTLLDNLLEWSRREAKAYAIEGVSIKEIADRVNDTMESLAKAKKISIHILVNNQDPKVLADKQVLELTLRNLISNAIKFSPQNGWVKLRSYEFQDSIHIEIEDNGLGMDKRQLERLFTKGREITIGTANEKGVGLGLLLCQEFIQKMKGEIIVRSTLNKGSCFTIILPKENQ
jgi:two-component system sensor histidine kinase/response regulator